MTELIEWLIANKIRYSVVDDEVIEIDNFGKMFYEDTDNVHTILKKDIDGNIVFNCLEETDLLIKEEIFYVVFKFGNNWYYTDIREEFSLNILKYVGIREEPKCKCEYVNLGCHTGYELLNGSFMPAMWIKKAVFLGHKAIGICDNNTMAGCYNLQKECGKAGINPVFGYSLTFQHREEKVGAKVYALNNKGMRNMMRIQKAIMVDSEDKTITSEELINRGGGMAIVFDKYSTNWMLENKVACEAIMNAFELSYYQVDLSEYKAERIDIKVLESTKLYFDNVNELDGEYLPAPILLSDAYYLDKDDAQNKIILNKIAEGAAHEQSEDQYFKDIDEQYALFAQLFDSNNWDIDSLFKKCCDNTLEIAYKADAKFENTRNFMPKYTMTEEEQAKYGTTHNMFTQLLEEGLNRLIPEEDRDKYRKQMEYEKYILESTNNVDYLLVQYDTCNWSRKNGILVGCGRGSAAGSLLLYLLGITLIDPIKYNLIFERFLLPERAGLFPAKTTIIGQDIESTSYMEITLDNGKTIKLDKDAQLMVKRGESEPISIYADEIQENDDILLDNKDVIFTINEI